MASENTIYFFPGRGGHSHDGDNSSFIDTSKYSLFDFSWGIFGDPSRIADQTRNYISFESFIINTVNNAVLKPANIILQPGTVNGTSHIVSRSIDTGLITANAITANEILAGTITSNKLTANFVLVNTIIASGDFNGTFDANTFALSNTGTDGWAITSSGDAVFTNGLFRGNLVVGVNDYWLSNGDFALGGNTGIFRNAGGGITLGANVTIQGGVVATSVSTPGIDILSNGAISSANFNVSPGGNITATNVNLTGEIHASTGSIDGDIISGGTISGVELDIGANFYVDASGNLTATNVNLTGNITATSGSFSGNLLAGGTISSTDISGVNISGVDISGSNITVGGRIALPSNGTEIRLGTASGGSATQVTIYDGGSQGMLIDTSGSGSTRFSGATWFVNGAEFAVQRYITGLQTFTGSGTTLVVSSAGEVKRISSKRGLKNDIQDFSDISLIDKLRPVTFTWKQDLRENREETEDARLRRESSINIGFIAEEVEEASDGLLSVYNYNEGGEGEVEMYKYLDIIALSVANIKDLRSRVAELESRLTEIEG